MTCKICPKCEAKFMDGQLFWSTGQKGDPEVLANLVCDLPQVQRSGGCINKAKSNPSKDTWENAGRLLMQWLMRWTCLLAQRILSLGIFCRGSTTDQRYPESMDDGNRHKTRRGSTLAEP